LIESDLQAALVDVYRRELLSFLQYVNQASPYAGAKDRQFLERVRELARLEGTELERFAGWLDRNHIAPPYVGAFPTAFTNYNFVALRKLLPEIIADERRGISALERDASAFPAGDARVWVETLAATKRLHVNELERLSA
jgi:hypothetical protein